MNQIPELKFELSKDDKRKLRFDLAQLFFGLTRANWVNGGNLGAARYNAMKQMESYISTKNHENPAIKYVLGLMSENKNAVLKSSMESKKSGKVLDLPQENKKQTTAWATKPVNDALGKLNGKIQEFEIKPEQLMALMMFQIKSNQQIQK